MERTKCALPGSARLARATGLTNTSALPAPNARFNKGFVPLFPCALVPGKLQPSSVSTVISPFV